MRLMESIRYSPRPLTEYARTIDGTRVGPGVLAQLVRDEAAWNIFFLSFPNLEDYTDFAGGPPLWDYMNPVADLAAETATQFVGAASVRGLVMHLEPAAFVREIRTRPHAHLALLRLYKPHVWFDLMQARACLYVPRLVIPAASGGLTRQQDGTSAANSTNILPLSQILKLRLH